MCFSATASLVSSSVLLTTGGLVYKNSKSRENRTLTVVPLIFGVQQLIEGFLWVCLQNPDYSAFSKYFTFLFLTIAWVVWPMIIPVIFSGYTKVFLLRLFSNLLLAIGIMVAIFNAYSLVADFPYAEIQDHHILYHWSEFRVFAGVIGYLYVAATLLPPFLTNKKPLWVLGLANTVMFLISYFFMTRYLISIWCFFAALCSMIILGIVVFTRKQSLLKGN
jgi:hypothetical protein